MCGICGIINLNAHPADDHLLKPMMRAMKHRGPDDEGTFEEDNVTLGFVRLSIIDLTSAGHQPMLSEDGNLVLIFNGEIYNYIELKEELTKLGHRFKTRTDTEVLLHAYQQWGSNCMDKLNGMWAFVIYDRTEKKLFASRDRVGVKPFYYYTDGERFIFASEIAPILSILPARPNPDLQSIFDFLAFNRTDQTEATFFEGVKKLQHGHQLTIINNKIYIKKWYDLRTKLNDPFKHPDEFRELLSESIGLRLRSDVPIGVCLSGGIDSSSIVSLLLKDHKKHDLNTFSAVYGKGQFGDESNFIDEYRPQLKNMFFITPDANSLYADIGNFVRAHAEPISSTSPYVQFKVMKLAHGKAVVMLDGQGADEQLAGYHYFFGIYFKELLKNGNVLLLSREVAAYMRQHRSLFGLKAFLYFLMPDNIRTHLKVREKAYINEDFAKQYATSNTISNSLYASKTLKDALIDHFEFKLEHLMKWEDRNSMWYSIEAREPFLDYRLIERTLALPSDQKIKNGTTKYILREAMKGTLPEKIRVRQDKMGFDNPQAEWFRTKQFQQLVSDILETKSFVTKHLVDPGIAKKIYTLHLDRKTDKSNEIWKWIHLDMWFRQFLAGVVHFFVDFSLTPPLFVEI
jgi:asparagine synthase (glutamine-hydrolysing)